MLHALSTYIRKRQTPVARLLYRFAKSVRGLNVPVIRPLHGALYSVHIGVVVSWRWLVQKCYCEPLFKSRCASCGRGLVVDGGLPLVSGHLELLIGQDVFISGSNGFVAPAVLSRPRLVIGDRTMIGGQTTINVARSVTIGQDCLIAKRVLIADNYGHPLSPDVRRGRITAAEIKDVVIDDNVWIGNGAVISPGVHVGVGSIIAANAVVTQDVPPNTVVMGSPARVVRQLK